ncbi:type II secretion system protein [Allofournierella sp.]|uniref:type II secretion system protein n=1 Tax=Allofournierella sp. TaxID=1940256 RepID=UPI003AB73B1C
MPGGSWGTSGSLDPDFSRREAAPIKKQTKQGFTIVELVAAIVVLAFAALVLAVMMNTAWQLRAQAKAWQDQAAQLNPSTAQSSGLPAGLTLNSGSAALTASGSYSRSAGGLLGVWVWYPLTMDWSALTQSKVAAQPLPASGAGDPLALAAPQPPAAALPGSFSASGSTGGEGYAPAMAASAIGVDQHVSVVLRQEFLYLRGGEGGQGDISSAYEKGGSPGSLTAAPASGSDQPLLVYVAGPLTVSSIPKGEGSPAHAWTWQPGWYAVPAGADLFSASLNEAEVQNWRLDFSGILRRDGSRPVSNGDLTDAERAELAQRLDKAYARLVLAGVTFGP